MYYFKEEVSDLELTVMLLGIYFFKAFIQMSEPRKPRDKQQSHLVLKMKLSHYNQKNTVRICVWVSKDLWVAVLVNFTRMRVIDKKTIRIDLTRIRSYFRTNLISKIFFQTPHHFHIQWLSFKSLAKGSTFNFLKSFGFSITLLRAQAK
jgi:hypothetical protein